MTNYPTTAPDAGHAAEPIEAMGNDELVDLFQYQTAAMAFVEGYQQTYYDRTRYDELHAELMRRLDSAPARTGDTETSGE